MRRAALAMLALACVVATPGLAAACPVCYDPKEGNGSAFLLMTIFMSLLPLAMIGGVVAFLRHHAAEAERPEHEPSRGSASLARASIPPAAE